MKREKYVYNPSTLQFEKHRITVREITLKVFGYISAVLFSASALIFLSYRYFPSPKERELMREVNQMETQFGLMNEQLDQMGKVLGNIHERDGSIYRLMFEMEPLDNDVWNGGIGGHDKYALYKNFREGGELMSATMAALDKLERQLVLQSKSLDTIAALAMEKEIRLASIPSIKPIREDKLKRRMTMLSGFGMRIHPIHKLPKFHYGIDFTCPRGTEIQATGNGTVVQVSRTRTGYGNSVLIDHGYGYVTLYGHMQTIDVKVGEKVMKGQKIGMVGNTGTSTAPHLHYEVRYHGNPINPVDFCLDGLTPEEYQHLVEMASETNQSFDY